MRQIFVAALIGGFATSARCQNPSSERASWVTVLGRDTVALESFARNTTHVDGDVVIRVPATVRFRYAVDRTPDGRFVKSVLETIPLGTADIPAQKIAVIADRDSVRIAIDSGGQQRKATRPLAHGAAPFFLTGFYESFGLYESLGLWEFFLAQSTARPPSSDTISLPSIAIATGRSGTRRYIRQTARAVDIDFFKIAYAHLVLDDSAHIVSVDAHETTEKTDSKRVAYFDAEKAAKSFAARDRSGSSMGSASPNQVVTATLGSARLRIAFGSPRLRGREILGHVVPYGQVWRTGANSATELAVDHDITIGSANVPAGAYTLWTLPQQDGVMLIINRQTGQWGTEYHPEQDLVRVPMHAATAPQPRENFAIGVEGRELQISWDRFVWSVPIALK